MKFYRPMAALSLADVDPLVLVAVVLALVILLLLVLAGIIYVGMATFATLASRDDDTAKNGLRVLRYLLGPWGRR